MLVRPVSDSPNNLITTSTTTRAARDMQKGVSFLANPLISLERETGFEGPFGGYSVKQNINFQIFT